MYQNRTFYKYHSLHSKHNLLGTKSEQFQETNTFRYRVEEFQTVLRSKRTWHRESRASTLEDHPYLGWPGLIMRRITVGNQKIGFLISLKLINLEVHLVISSLFKDLHPYKSMYSRPEHPSQTKARPLAVNVVYRNSSCLSWGMCSFHIRVFRIFSKIVYWRDDCRHVGI